jgi:hypothetical protein
LKPATSHLHDGSEATGNHSDKRHRTEQQHTDDEFFPPIYPLDSTEFPTNNTLSIPIIALISGLTLIG